MPRGILSVINPMLEKANPQLLIYHLYRIAGPRPRPHRHVFRSVVRNGVAHVHYTIHIPRQKVLQIVQVERFTHWLRRGVSLGVGWRQLRQRCWHRLLVLKT